jgi:hypothetical protein
VVPKDVLYRRKNDYIWLKSQTQTRQLFLFYKDFTIYVFLMSLQMTKHIELDRTFWPVEADQENDPESIRAMLAFGLGKQLSWEDLLGKDRVVILAEPGTGKTEEFRAITRRLRMASKPAFFCRIELLQEMEIQHSLDIGTAEEFDEWINGNKEAYFFLDSVDEARLNSRTAFEIALRRFSNTIGERLDRAKVFVSCRVSNWRATGCSY